MMPCVQCGQRAVHQHHCCYVQELRRVARSAGTPWSVLVKDKRNLIPLCLTCHDSHHARTAPLPLSVLPDSVFEFAREVLGAGPGYNYLTRAYSGDDARANALLIDWEKAA